jgi:ribosomal protein L11 methyltransferase
MYRSITAYVPEEMADDLSALLFDYGAEGVEVEDSSVKLMPGKEPPPAGKARLIGYFSPEGADAALRAALTEAVGEEVELVEQELPDKDWNEVWKSHFAPIEVSPRLWVCPSWRLGETPPEAKVLVLDPGMAFGTGTHATTSLCLEAIDEFLARRPGASVLDVGTGSGILAIAAKLLGAGRVIGTDNDIVAVRVARENATLNKVEVDLSTVGLNAVKGPFQLVVANIMAQTLIDLAPSLAKQMEPGGELFLSGILDFQGDDVAEAFAENGLEGVSRREKGEWVLLHFKK